MNNIDNPMFEPAEGKCAVHEGETTGPEYRRTANSTWVFVLALAVAIVGVVCFGYFNEKTNIRITKLFGNQAALSTLGQRIGAAEGKLRDLTGAWEGVARRVTALEGFQGKVSRDFQQTRKYAESLTEQLHQVVTAEIQARTSILDARLHQVESDEASQSLQLAKLEADLREEIMSAREETGHDLSGVHQQVESNARILNSLSRRLDRERVDFEAAKGATTELAPGVSLQIN